MQIIGVILYGLSIFVFMGLSWVTFLCEGDTVRKLAVLFGILSVKSLLLLALIVFSGMGLLEISLRWVFVLTVSPFLELVAVAPFGVSMFKYVRKLNAKK